MFSAPYRDVRRAVREGNLGDLNPTPWAFMLGNCCGWITYGFLIQNLFVFFANAPGFILSVWLNMQAAKLQYENSRSTEMRKSLVNALEEKSKSSLEIKPSESLSIKPTTDAAHPTTVLDYSAIVWDVAAQKMPVPAQHETLVLVMVILWVGTIAIIAFGTEFTSNTRELIVGIVVNLNLVFFYGAPLSSILTILKTRSSSSIHWPTMITNTANGAFWCAFGFAVWDLFIFVPNGLGAVLGIVQFCLCLVFPAGRKPTLEVAESVPPEIQTSESDEVVEPSATEAKEEA